MTLYLDVIFFLNFSFDFLLLLSVSIILRRKARLYKILLGSLIGSLSIFILFIKINSIQLFFFKLIISIIMIIISFDYKDIKYTCINLFYLYIASIILGGFLYFLNIQFSYKQTGLVFYNKGLSINFIVLVIISPIIIYIYVRQSIRLKNHYSNYYELTLYLKNKKPIILTAFLDTGNHLRDPYSNKPVILVNHNVLNINHFYHVLIPFKGVNNSGLIKCVYAEVELTKTKARNSVLVGVLEENIKIDGINCIIQNRLLEASDV